METSVTICVWLVTVRVLRLSSAGWRPPKAADQLRHAGARRRHTTPGRPGEGRRVDVRGTYAGSAGWWARTRSGNVTSWQLAVRRVGADVALQLVHPFLDLG